MTFRTRALCLTLGSMLAACSSEAPTASPVQAPLTEPVLTAWSSFSQLSTSLAPIKALSIPTYDGSGQVVHPDIQYIPGGWNGWEYWMAFTPYAKADSSLENPSIVVSHDGLKWVVPPGTTNPLAFMPPKGYNSDPDLTFDKANNQLVMLYREVVSGNNQIQAIRSSDGVHWSSPKLLFKRPNHGMVSPSITSQNGGVPSVWYVNAGPSKCLQRVTRVYGQTALTVGALNPSAPETGWGAPHKVALDQPTYFIWHLDVNWIPELKEYWAVYPAYRQRVCGERSLFFARSPDGVKWTTYRVPFMRPRDVAWMNMTVYRTTSLYDATHNSIRLWISAAAGANVWSLSYVEYDYNTFLQALENGIPDSPTIVSPATLLFGSKSSLVRDDGP